jgi:hypothetical protein
MSYAIDGIVRAGYLYTVTARTGSGKTAFNVVAALAVATGRQGILGLEIEKGRVACLVFENPDDTRVRLIAATARLGIALADVASMIEIIDVRKKPEQLCADLQAIGPFSLVLIDTLQSFLDVNDSNNNAEAVDFLRRVRPMTRIAGNPAVIISAHPVKNAGDDNLIPYGAGAILNEVDGNLTLSKCRERIKLHWQGKLRGVEFAPVVYQIESVKTDRVVDTKGRQFPVPVMAPGTRQSEEAHEIAETLMNETGRRLLLAMLDNPDASQADLAKLLGVSKSTVNNWLNRLKVERLAENALGKWCVLPKGQRAVGGARPRGMPSVQAEVNDLILN